MARILWCEMLLMTKARACRDLVSLLGIRPRSYATLCDIDNGYYVSGEWRRAQHLNLIKISSGARTLHCAVWREIQHATVRKVVCIIECYSGEVFTAMSASGHMYQGLLHLLILLNTDPDPVPCSCLLGKSLTSPSYNWVMVIVLLQTASYGIISLPQAVIISLG